MSPVRKKNWVAYAKPPFAGPQAVLAYLSLYTRLVAISNSRLVRFDETGATLRYKNYRNNIANRQQLMTLAAYEFIRRFRWRQATLRIRSLANNRGVQTSANTGQPLSVAITSRLSFGDAQQNWSRHRT